MTPLNAVDTWQTTVADHWHPLIDQALDAVADQPWQPVYDPTADKTALKAELQNHLATVETAIDDYRTQHPGRGAWIDALLSLLFYVQLAKVAPSPVVPVTPPPSLPGDDLRQLFAWWTQALPQPDNLFQVDYNGGPAMPVYAPLAEPPVTQVTGTFSLSITANFTAALQAIDGAADGDLERLQALPTEIQARTRERVAYGVFAGQDAVIEPTDLQAKAHLLGPMHGTAVLDTFGWAIKGLNA